MAFRMMSYVSLLYLDFYAEKRFAVKQEGQRRKLQFPPIFPIVLYNGKTRWRKALEVSDLIVESPLGLEPYRPQLRYCLIDEGAYATDELELRNLVSALFRLENSQSKEEVDTVVQNLIVWLDSAEQNNLVYAFTAWLNNVLLPKRYPEITFDKITTLEGVRTMLSETSQGWYDEIAKKSKAEGISQGISQGISEGLAKGFIFTLEKRFKRLDSEQEAILLSLNENELMQAMEYSFQADTLADVFTQIKRCILKQN